MTDLDALLEANPAEPETAITVVVTDRKCRRHTYTETVWQTSAEGEFTAAVRWTTCRTCGAIKDDVKSRRGKTARRSGHDNERRLERLFGATKVGEFGTAVDLLGRDFCWQAKHSHGEAPSWTRDLHEPRLVTGDATVRAYATAMAPHLAGRAPLVVRSWATTRTVDRIWVPAAAWSQLHGTPPDASGRWLVMSGEWFLEVHGRDENTP